MAKVASDFEKMIHADRARKKNEALAARIFNKDRRSSAPIKATSAGPLTSHAGVKKRVSLASVPRSAGNINSEWTHDLHDKGAGSIPRGPRAATAVPANTLASRISRPGQQPIRTSRAATATTAAATSAAVARGQQRRAAQVARAIYGAEQTNGKRQTRQQQQQQKPAAGLSIRGIAAAVNEPLVVMAQNFAPGTTAADIESAMTPVGGLVSSCRILKTAPLVIAEIVFETREGALRVIETFNNQTADGRLLHVYPKAGQQTTAAGQPAAAVPRALAAASSNNSNGLVVDGSLGFDDPMDTDSLSSSKLYSDDLVGSKPPTGPAAGGRRSGRGGRGGRGGRR